MNKAPLILVSPSTQRTGAEFSDASISLSNRYFEAVISAGGIPVAIPFTADSALIAEYVRRSDGVMLTGGDDVQPKLYAPKLSEDLAKKVGPQEPERDLLELQMIDEVFRQRKPLLAICRGHQILNVALGGTLIVDIPTQVPQALNHRQINRKSEPVHSVALTPDSDLAKSVRSVTLNVNSTHHQAVGKIAEPLTVVATSEDGIIEAMELKNKKMLPYLISVQFHPERLCDRYKEFNNLFESFTRSCIRSFPQKI
jgi:putative glutamine amidotransferase